MQLYVLLCIALESSDADKAVMAQGLSVRGGVKGKDMIRL
jgi:hypothetical protein